MQFEACSWPRSYTLNFRSAQTVDEVMSEKSMMNPEKTEINGLTIVKFTDVGMCNYPTLYVIGNKYNYEFRPLCSVDDEKEFEFLEEIVRSLELID